MNEQVETSGKYLKSLTVIYFALLMGQVTLGIVVVFVQSGRVDTVEAGAGVRDIFMIVLPVVVLMLLFASNIFFKNKLRKIKAHNNFIMKMHDYRTTSIIRFALVETAYLFAMVVYFITGDFSFVIAALMVLFYFLVIRPTTGSVSVDLELKHNEK